MNAFKVVADFEQALCDYCGSPFAVAVNSCTSAILLCLDYFKQTPEIWPWEPEMEIPKRTYVSIPMQILNVGGKPVFRDEDWSGMYQIRPYPLWDAARRFTSGMFDGTCNNDFHYLECDKQLNPKIKRFMCPSFHWSKILGIQQGGAILHNCPEADPVLRRMRFDGRQEGVEPKLDTFPIRGWHAYLAPEIAAEGLVRLSFLPKHNEDLPNSDYPDLSQIPLFGGES